MKKRKPSFRVPSMDIRVKRADKAAHKWHPHSDELIARAVAYRAWHRGYDAAVRDIRAALAKAKP